MRATAHRPGLIEAAVWALVLAAVVGVAAVIDQRRATDDMRPLAQARDMLRLLNSALQAPRPDGRPMPDTTAGLAALVADGTIDHVPLDPWGRPYVYRNPGQVRSYDLLSLGPDGIESADDIPLWNLYGGRNAVAVNSRNLASPQP